MKHTFWIFALSGVILLCGREAQAGVSAPSNVATATTLPAQKSDTEPTVIEWPGPFQQQPQVSFDALEKMLTNSGKREERRRTPEPSTCVLLAGGLMIAVMALGHPRERAARSIIRHRLGNDLLARCWPTA